MGWGEGLTEDYQLRQRLLLEGIRIAYEPSAVGYGEAAPSLAQARAQRMRWLRGTRDASRQYVRRLLAEGIKCRNMMLLDGALQALLPSYSTLAMVGGIFVALQLLANLTLGSVFAPGVLGAWAAAVGVLFAYPFFGLALERAPVRAYVAMLSGPLFVVWRTWLALASRLGGPVVWIRTAHGEAK
jgi:cellulose synthase/poly-beta-1,6-N-acetylglucosamine synthase-like glycosyltransferase